MLKTELYWHHTNISILLYIFTGGLLPPRCLCPVVFPLLQLSAKFLALELIVCFFLIVHNLMVMFFGLFCVFRRVIIAGVVRSSGLSIMVPEIVHKWVGCLNNRVRRVLGEARHPLAAPQTQAGISQAPQTAASLT